MDEQKTLTLDFIKSLMEPAYTLIWTDYNDNLDNHCGLIQKCLDSKSREHLWEKADEWYSDAEWEAVREIIAKLKEECAVFHDFDGEAVDDFFDEYEDEIRDEIYSRNDSDVVKELVRHTDDIPIRVEMLSNYDCINSNWFESQGGYRYEEPTSGHGGQPEPQSGESKENLDRARLQGLRAFPRTVRTGTARSRFPTNNSTRNLSIPAAGEPADLHRQGKPERAV